MDASEMKEKIGRFRILIIGRASAGKTSILQRFCNTSDSPEIFNSAGEKIDDTVLGASRGRGGNDIKNETVFQINPGFVFHDSRGFEAGGESEFNNVKEFIEDRSKQPDIKDRIHTIWYCIPMDEESRSFTQAEIKFFSHCNTGSIPVVVLFTKFDALYDVEFARLQKQGNSRTVAKELTPKNVEEQFSNGSQLKFLYNSKDIQRPPNCHVCLADMDKKDADCGPLIERTAGTLKNEVLQQLFVSTQQTNLELCMKYAVERELAGLVASEEEISYEDTIARSSCWFPLIQMLDRAHREEMQSKILAVVSGSSPLEKSIQLSSAAAIIFEHSFYIFSKQRYIQDQKSYPSVLDALEQYMASPQAAAVREAVSTAIQAYQEAASTSSPSSWRAKLPFGRSKRKAKTYDRKEELIKTILEITLQHRLPRP